MRGIRPGRLAVLAAAAALAALACGCARREVEAPPVPERFVIALSPGFSAALTVIADGTGIFARHGIEAELAVVGSGVESIAALLDGRADVASGTAFPMLAADFDADRLRIIATSSVSGNSIQVVARSDRGVSAVADLAGKRVGALADGIPEYILDLMLLEAKVPKEAVDIVRGDLPSLFAEFSAGSLDALCCFGAWIERCRAAFPGRTVALGDEALISIATAAISTVDTIERRRAGLVRVIEAYLETEAWMAGHSKEALDMLVERLGLDPAATAAVWNPGLFGVRIEQSMVREMENLARWMMEEGSKKVEAMPDVLDYIEFGLLESIDPERVTVIH